MNSAGYNAKKGRLDMQYESLMRNHVVLPGREEALDEFLDQTYEGMRHKRKNSRNSNSEDALTWSCFDLLRNLEPERKARVLNEMWEDAYQGEMDSPFLGFGGDDIRIEIGKKYTGSITDEATEVDASIEWSGGLVFFEAKLYSAVSFDNSKHDHDQIVRKLRVGLDNPLGEDDFDFYFIFLDIAPREKLVRRKSKSEAYAQGGGFHDKWRSAWLFNYYKCGRNRSHKPLKDALKDLEGKQAKNTTQVAENMGWLTWADLFKDLLRGMI